MEKRRIGSLEVSLVGLGCNNFGSRVGEAASLEVIHAAVDAGINFFDTADIYGETHSEEFLGRALGARRGQVLIASKFGYKIDEARPGGASPAYIQQALEDSLRRLGTDHLDLYQIHRPDTETPIAETLGALDRLVKAGKVREIGCSNFSAAQLKEAESALAPGAARFVSVQNEYSLMKRDHAVEVLPECARQGMGFLPYFPLASGLLTGKVRLGQPVPPGTRLLADRFKGLVNDSNLRVVESLITFAETRGHSILELAFSWLAMWPEISSVIAGATSPAQVKANALAADWKLSHEEMVELDGLVKAGLKKA